MSYKKLSLKAAIILIAAIMLPWQTLEAREQMRISRVGISQAIPYSYDVVGMVGDSLALFDFEVTNSSVTIKRGFVTPDAVVTPLQTIHTFTAPPDWETINGYLPYSCKHYDQWQPAIGRDMTQEVHRNNDNAFQSTILVASIGDQYAQEIRYNCA